MSNNKKLSRRDFFNFGARRTAKAVGELVEASLKKNFPRTSLRPPGAISEESFLLTCTHCSDCVTACPHDAIHLMESASGLYKGTPFIDVYHKACYFCKDMPCIESCKAGALKYSVDNNNVGPIGKAVVVEEHCLLTQGQMCDYCFNSCPQDIKAIKKGENGAPEINIDECVGCGLCAYICVSQTGKAIKIVPE